MPHKRIGHKVRSAAIRLGAKAGKPLKNLVLKLLQQQRKLLLKVSILI
jgi:hypothetical protein